MTTWKVGQPCILVDNSQRRNVREGTVTKVGRKYVTVDRAGFGSQDFDMETGRNRGEYFDGTVYTVEGYAMHQKRASVFKALGELRDNWHRLNISDSQLDDLAGVIGRMT